MFKIWIGYRCQPVSVKKYQLLEHQLNLILVHHCSICCVYMYGTDLMQCCTRI